MFQDLSFLDEVKTCPHCKETLSLCEAPPIHVGDGLGWGSDVLFICLNDGCSLFLNGWDKIEAQYGHHASYRYMELPGSPEGNCMMVGNSDAFKACIVNKEELKNQNARYRQEKEAIKQLESCIADNNIKPVMTLLLDEGARKSVRVNALGYLAELNDLACVDPLRNHKFRDPAIEQKVNQAISELLKTNFKKECPHCLEIVKGQAKKCMHCKEDL
ncbi:MAG: zinc ribbon domain-containing protein [Desulfobulbaceae bacterium]|nr:zinc ribbon domain-containing protein [Desulfobulbaceae bacterium]